jgi:hypothetical protein
MENKAIWDAVSKPPISALKQIQAGRLKGKSDISPMALSGNDGAIRALRGWVEIHR